MSEAKYEYECWLEGQETLLCKHEKVRNYVTELEQQNKDLREALKRCMAWLKKESKSMPNYDITQSVLWQNFEEILKQEERDER